MYGRIYTKNTKYDNDEGDFGVCFQIVICSNNEPNWGQEISVQQSIKFYVGTVEHQIGLT